METFERLCLLLLAKPRVNVQVRESALLRKGCLSAVVLIAYTPVHAYLLQSLKAGDLITWDPNGNGYYITPKNKWYVEAGRYDEKGAGGGLGQWDRDHHYDVWGKPFLYGDTGVQCMNPGCSMSNGAGDV